MTWDLGDSGDGCVCLVIVCLHECNSLNITYVLGLL